VKLDHTWWTRLIEQARQQEKALGRPVDGSPTADALQKLYELHSEMETKSEAPEGDAVTLADHTLLLVETASVCNQWIYRHSDRISTEMWPNLVQLVAWLGAELVGERKFLEDYSPGRVILEERIMGSIVSILDKLGARFVATQTVLVHAVADATSATEIRDLLRRWLLLFLAYTDTRRGTRYQNLLKKAKAPKQKWGLFSFASR
jgi:hypothetical protein